MDLNESTTEIKKTFWDYPNYPFLDEKAKTFYAANYDRLRKNAEDLFEQHPIECAIFWIQIIRSPFFVKFGHDINSVFNHKSDFSTTEQAVKAIKTVFESSYQYFGFLAICEFLNKNSPNALYEFWSDPDQAKEYPKQGLNPWKNGKENVTGKIWAINNCPLLHFSSHNLDLLKRVRNAESHEKLVVKEDNVFLLDKDDVETISKEQIIDIANYLKGVVNLCLHFYAALLIRDRFWIFLSIFYANNPEYGLKKLPLEILKKESKEENLKKRESKSNFFHKGFLSLILFCVEYTTKDLWLEMKKDVPKLNKYLAKMAMEINEEKIGVLQTDAFCDLYNAVVFANQEFRKIIQKNEYPFVEISATQIEEVNFRPLLNDTLEIALKVNRNKKSNGSASVIVITIVASILVLFGPFNRLFENLKDLTKSIKPLT